MVNLIRDPKGESVMEPSASIDKAMQQQIQILKPLSSSQQDEVARLKQRVTELEKELYSKGIKFDVQPLFTVSNLIELWDGIKSFTNNCSYSVP